MLPNLVKEQRACKPFGNPQQCTGMGALLQETYYHPEFQSRVAAFERFSVPTVLPAPPHPPFPPPLSPATEWKEEKARGGRTGAKLAPWPPGFLARWGLSWRPSNSLGDLTLQSRKNGRVGGQRSPDPLPRLRSARLAGRESRLGWVPASSGAGPAWTPGSASRSGAHLERRRPGPRAPATEGPARAAGDRSQGPRAPRAPRGARQALGALPAPSARRSAARRPRPPPTGRSSPLPTLLLRPLPSPAASPTARPSVSAARARSAGGEATAPAAVSGSRTGTSPPATRPPSPLRRVSHDTGAPRPATMTTSLQDGQSAAGRAAARDSPLAAQVCGAAQGRGDARDLAPAPWLHARELLPPPDGTRGCAADRRKKKDLDVLEMPSIPNPFPELCCSPFTSVLSAGLFPKANSGKKQ
ncbi:uncharacterized protein LOC141570772 [Rhinolophus sinicus]|uniref:uncharacterized protein LOC141570772 n=1 Tax=Rhinolophus sinicus TaxID=89399 RepID=UPI003D7AD50B